MNSIRTYSQDENLINTRREQIARGAAHLLVKKGYDKASIREIAKTCNMSIGTMYHYVGSKEDILSLVFEYFMSRNVKFCEFVNSCNDLAPKEALQNIIERYFRGVDDIQDMALLAYQESMNLKKDVLKQVLEREKEMISAIEGILTKGCEAGEFKIDDISLVANNIVVLGDTWAFKRWFLSKRYTIVDYIREQIKIIIDGISAHKR
ncbi:MAG: TetR/AcrR family transcriptional regulator [Deltaproteobacteria bacterium]|nr:TetR/AcrR family transcriptional regulator [Deltaproteobacteria bacterium]